jgi:hypothetical protein
VELQEIDQTFDFGPKLVRVKPSVLFLKMSWTFLEIFLEFTDHPEFAKHLQTG